jgi:hypothetical protein
MDELLSALCSLPALLFGIMSKTLFEELNNPPFLIATTLGTMSAFGTFASVITLTSVMWFIQTSRLAFP